MSDINQARPWLSMQISEAQEKAIHEVERFGLRVEMLPMVEVEGEYITLGEALRKVQIRKSWSGQIDPFKE
jgi:hypothetical protein